MPQVKTPTDAHPFVSQADWKPVGSTITTGDLRFIQCKGETWMHLYNVSEQDLARNDVQKDIQDKDWILCDPRPTLQRTTRQLKADGILGLCVLARWGRGGAGRLFSLD